MKNKRIFNWGWYGFENFGDDLLQTTMLDKFKELNIGVTFPMESLYEELEVRQVARSYKELFTQSKDCDVLIIGPGGLFPFANVKKLLLYYLAILLWKIKKRQVVFFGIGISKQMDSVSKILWRRIIKHSDIFYTRSDGFLENIGAQETETIRTIADVAFASKVTEPGHKTTKKVGISVANLFEDGDEEAYMQCVKMWCDVCRQLVSCNYEVDLIAFTKGRDDTLIEDIMNNLGTSELMIKVHPILYEKISDAVANWSQYEQVICVRFHSLVLSILAMVPALPIAYGHKTASLAEECGLSDYLLYWNPANKRYWGEFITTDAQSIINSSCDINKNREMILCKMSETKERLTHSADTAFKVLIDFLDDGSHS